MSYYQSTATSGTSGAVKEVKPSLAGASKRTRKRNQVIPFEPKKFSLAVIPAFRDAGSAAGLESGEWIVQLDAAEKRDTLDFQRYGDIFWEVVIAGGIVAPGGELPEDEELNNPVCVFTAEPEEVTHLVTVAHQMLQRKPFLRPKLEEAINKLVLFLDTYSEEESKNFATFIGLFFARGNLAPASFINPLRAVPRLVENGSSLEFCTHIFAALLSAAKLDRLLSALRLAKVEDAIIELMPKKQRTFGELAEYFSTKGLDVLATYLREKNTKESLRDIKMKIGELFEDEAPIPEMVHLLKGHVENGLSESVAAGVAFDSIMATVQWSKKTQQHPMQALKQLNAYHKLLYPFTCESGKAQLNLMLHIQTYCYDIIHLLPCFHQMMQLLYQHEVISEQAIRVWFAGKKKVSNKARQEFLKQMEPFIKWLDTAEEEPEN
eukprot:TRINITY_DN268_c0_g1_i1.p1 TRINITY_DN268_c0_g1~~TRINITY_DN268_c0_g1_i1.p1  ORF type:complete len:435 (+),score=139.52 TRINITY_DN268_c0_g1_i1:189-1493(+)